MPKLKRYEDAQREKAPAPAALIPSGVACTDTLCRSCKRKHRSQERPIIGPVTSKEEREAAVKARREWEDQHERDLMPCDGEMGYVRPEDKHPELQGLKRAICMRCGWRGWC